MAAGPTKYAVKLVPDPVFRNIIGHPFSTPELKFQVI